MPISSGVPSTKALPTVRNFREGFQPTSTYSLSLGGTTYVFTGTAATLDVGTAPASGSYAFTGTAAALDVGIVLAGGSYSVTGTSATLNVGIVPASGSYVYSGTGATLDVGLVPVSGVYSFAGTSVSFSRTLSLNLAAGSYLVAGSIVAFIRSIPQSIQITHFYPVSGPYITEEKTAGYISSDSVPGVNETYYRQE